MKSSHMEVISSDGSFPKIPGIPEFLISQKICPEGPDFSFFIAKSRAKNPGKDLHLFVTKFLVVVEAVWEIPM